MSKVTFDGLNKLITVITGVTYLDVKTDIYQEWKKWVIEDNNSQWLQAFRTFGGDPTTSNQNAPSYYFLINEWKIKIENLDVIIQQNLYSDDYDNPFININSTIISKGSDIPGIDTISNTLTGITDTINSINIDLKLVLGLVQNNYRLSNHVYDSSDRLLSVIIKLYNTKSDCDNSIDEFATYQMNASYDTNGLLIDYKVVKI